MGYMQMDILPRKSTLLIAVVVLALLIAILASGNVAFGCAVLITGPLLCQRLNNEVTAMLGRRSTTTRVFPAVASVSRSSISIV